MTSQLRPPKKTDQQFIEKAFQIMYKVMRKHPEFEGSIWVGAIWSTLVQGYIEAGISYDEFCDELKGIKENYKIWWDKK